MNTPKFVVCMSALLTCVSFLSAREIYPAGDFEGTSIKPLHCRRYTSIDKKRNFKIPQDLIKERIQNEKAFSGKQSLLVEAGKDFDTICKEIVEYKEKGTSLVFSLESLHNLANNGRVSHLVAKGAGLLNIRPLGIASEIGTLEMLEKPRGAKKAVESAYKIMLQRGYKGGKVYVAHCMNSPIAENMKNN